MADQEPLDSEKVEELDEKAMDDVEAGGEEVVTETPLDEQLDASGSSSTPSTEGEDSGLEEAESAGAVRGHAVVDEAQSDEVLPVHFAQLEAPVAQKIKPRLSRLNNVYVDVTVELGRKEMSVRELTDVTELQVIDLDKLAGEAFDILINGRPYAEGEIVVVTDLMAVRITRFIDYTAPEEEDSL